MPGRRLHDVTPIARVPTNQQHILLRYLDTGAQGVHVPWVNSAADAEAAVEGVKYGPRGVARSGRDPSLGLGDVGTARGVHDNCQPRDPGGDPHRDHGGGRTPSRTSSPSMAIDVLFLGPTDLSQSIGVPGQIHHPEVEAAMQRVAEVVVPSDKTLGLFAGTIEMAREWRHYGARYIATGTDGFLRHGMHEYLERVRA